MAKNNKNLKESRRKAFARGYFTGKDHYKQNEDSDRMTVRGAARRGYRKGMNDAHFEAKQRQKLKS